MEVTTQLGHENANRRKWAARLIEQFAQGTTADFEPQVHLYIYHILHAMQYIIHLYTCYNLICFVALLLAVYDSVIAAADDNCSICSLVQ